jgi:predicted SAM-dependent methyltransferase
MIAQSWKNIYLAVFAKLSVFSFLKHRLLVRPAKELWLNLGSGDRYIKGMTNIEVNVLRKKDIWLDLNIGLPFKDNRVKGIYSHHVLEHFKLAKLRRLLKECFRVLEPGGAMRAVVPSLEFAINAWLEKAPGRLSDWPQKFNSIGGRFNNFMLCDNQHLLMFDFSFLKELLEEAGFVKISRQSARQSSFFPSSYLVNEYGGARQDDSSLYLECRKPD